MVMEPDHERVLRLECGWRRSRRPWHERPANVRHRRSQSRLQELLLVDMVYGFRMIGDPPAVVEPMRM